MAELPKDMIFHYHSDDGITVKVDAIPLVRCRECKYSTLTYQGEMKYCEKLARKDEYGDFDPTFYVSGDWYCADGEREVQE